MGLPLRILLLENSTANGALLLQELRQSIYDPIWARVDTLSAFQAALDHRVWDVVLASDALPSLDVMAALQWLQEIGLDIPFLVLSRHGDEHAALACMQAGAHDYFLPSQLPRLVPAIARELRAASLRRSQEQTEVLLRQTLLEMERLVQQRAQDYDSIKRMKAEFIAIISHELRTPLASLQGSIDLLQHPRLGQLSPQGQRMLEIAATNTERLVQLINTIFDLQHFASCDATLKHRLYDIYPLIEQAVATLTPTARHAGVQMTLAVCSVPLWGDSDRILQILLHLLSNAIKFSRPGGTIDITLDVIDETTPPGNNPLQSTVPLPCLLLRIRDEGQGIPANQLAVIFEEFRQVDASDTRRRGGAGLGLALCRTIAHQHQGHLWVESQPGQGSTFYLALPIQTDRIEDTEIRDVLERPCDRKTSISY